MRARRRAQHRGQRGHRRRVHDRSVSDEVGPRRCRKPDGDRRAGGDPRDLHRECQTFGLAVPVGINSTTGVAGLTLGGGFGWLSRKYGMTIDNLIGADFVTAAGEVLRTSAEENPDRFRAIRGCGGNWARLLALKRRYDPENVFRRNQNIDPAS